MDCLSGKTLQKKDGGKVSVEDALSNKKIVAYYFSAHWCPPCRNFTPVLKEAYNDMVENDLAIDIIFVSSDRSEDEMKQYMNEAHGDWLAVPFGDPLVK